MPRGSATFLPEFKRVVKWRASLVLVARQISDVKGGKQIDATCEHNSTAYSTERRRRTGKNSALKADAELSGDCNSSFARSGRDQRGRSQRRQTRLMSHSPCSSKNAVSGPAVARRTDQEQRFYLGCPSGEQRTDDVTVFIVYHYEICMGASMQSLL